MESALTPDNLPLVIQEISSSANKWYRIGFQLGLSELELKSIESTHPRQHLDCLRDVIFKWLSSGARRRASLIEALRSPSVGETQLADQLTKKYSSPLTTTSVTMPAAGLTTKTPTASTTTVTLSNTITGSGGVGATGNSGRGKSLGRLETAIAGLKRKQLHTDNNGGDTPLIRKKLKTLDEGALYDPPSYAIDDFVTPQSSETCCIRCQRIPRKPLRLQCCDTLYCEPCAVAMMTCPEHGVGAEYKMDSILRGRISKLTVLCANEGCEAKCAVYQMRDHLTSCKGKNEKASTSNIHAKRRNIATSAKVLGTIDRAEPMDVGIASVISLAASTNQVNGSASQAKGVTNTSLNLRREPLQKGAGAKSAKDETPSPSLSSPLLSPQLPPLAEVTPGIPTLSQLQSTLTAVVALMNNAAANQKSSSSSGEKQPAVTVPTLKLPGGKEIKLGVSVKSEEKSKHGAPQLGGKVVAKPANVGGAWSQATTVAGLKQKQDVQKSVASPSVQSGVKRKLLTLAQQRAATTTPSSSATPPVKKTTPTRSLDTLLSSVTTPTAATSTEKAAKTISAESLKLGEAFTLSPSHQAKILGHSSQVHKSGAQSAAKRGAASAKASVTNQKKITRTLRSLTPSELETELKSVATKWRKLGRGLNQQDKTLEQISAENSNNPAKCLSAVLKKWHTVEAGGRAANVSLWMALLKTLRKDVIGEKSLADSLQEKYGTSVKIIPDKQQQSSSETTPTHSKSAPSAPSPITIGTLLANLPSSIASSTPSTTPTVAPPTSGMPQTTPIPFPTPALASGSQPASSTSTSFNVPPNIVTCAQGMPTVGSAMASIGQVDVFNLLKSSPVLQSIPSLQNLSGPLTANDLLQKLMEVARKATPSETSAILKSLQQIKGTSSSVVKTTPPSVAIATTTKTVTTPSARSTVPSSKATAPTNKDKGLADHTATSLTSNIAKSAASVATLIQKTAPGTSSVSDTPMEVEVSKAPTTAASTPAKSTSGLISPTKSVQSKSPMSVAVEVPKVKLSGAAIAAAMVTTAKTTTTTESNTTATSASRSASAASSSGEGESVDGDIGVKTRQKQKQKPVSIPIPDADLITLSDDDFSMKPRKEVHCSKCNHIPMNPQRPKCNCNVVYCDTCANAIPNCPLCGKNEGFEEDKAMRKRIWNLKVPCLYKSQGCDWRGELCKRGEHDLVCTKRSVPCKYEAIGCGEMVRANELSEHELECKEQHLQLAMDTVLRLVQQVKTLQDEVAQLKKT